jgi:hypothetical protein
VEIVDHMEAREVVGESVGARRRGEGFPEMERVGENLQE